MSAPNVPKSRHIRTRPAKLDVDISVFALRVRKENMSFSKMLRSMPRGMQFTDVLFAICSSVVNKSYGNNARTLVVESGVFTTTSYGGVDSRNALVFNGLVPIESLYLTTAVIEPTLDKPGALGLRVVGYEPQRFVVAACERFVKHIEKRTRAAQKQCALLASTFEAFGDK